MLARPDVAVVKAINSKVDGQHTVFKIRVQKTEDPASAFHINRGSKQFDELKNELVKTYKQLSSAPYPKKSFFGVSRDEKSQNTRRETLDAFLKACISHEDVLKNLSLIKFLQLSDTKPVLRISITEARQLLDYIHDGVLQPYWQIAFCTDKEFTKALPQTVLTETLMEPYQPTLTWANEVYEMVMPDHEIYGVRLNLYNGKTNTVKASVRIPVNTIPINQPVTHRFPLIPAASGAHNIYGDVQLTLSIQNVNSNVRSTIPAFELSEGLKNIKLLQQKHREFLLLEKKESCLGGSLHVILNYTPPMGTWESSFLVRVIEARNLSGSNINPYITVTWLNESKSTLVAPGNNPIYNQTFQFALRSEEVLNSVGMLRFAVWHLFDGNKYLLATSDIALEDVLPLITAPHLPVESEIWAPLFFPPAPVVDLLSQSKCAKLMREQGFHPKFPIVLIPGLASSALEVVEGKKDWIGSRVWLSLNKLTKTRVTLLWKKFTDNLNSFGESVASVFSKEDRNEGVDQTQVNNWIEHMSLADDCKSDPPGMKVRIVAGTAGVTYLEADSMLGKKYTYVCGPLIKNLLEFGYVENENLFAFPYDWRLPFAHLEARDGFLSALKKNIEEIVKKQQLPVVLFGHSMGCRLIHYFLNWIRNSVGQKWIDDHVQTFVAAGAPWLGAPKILRGTISGELMGMDPFLTQGQAIRLGRSFGSSPSLFPIDPRLFFYDDSKSFIYLRGEAAQNQNAMFTTDKGSFNPIDQNQMLNICGAVNQAQLLQEYLKDPAFGENPKLGAKHMMLEPPPVKNLVAIYGVDLPTELLYFYAFNARKRRFEPCQSFNAFIPDLRVKVKEGIGYETPETVQKCTHYLTGYMMARSGDGTVPYASLSYCYHWRNKIENLKVIELNQAEHRDTISTTRFFEILISIVGERPLKNLNVSMASVSDALGQLAFGANPDPASTVPNAILMNTAPIDSTINNTNVMTSIDNSISGDAPRHTDLDPNNLTVSVDVSTDGSSADPQKSNNTNFSSSSNLVINDQVQTLK